MDHFDKKVRPLLVDGNEYIVPREDLQAINGSHTAVSFDPKKGTPSVEQVNQFVYATGAKEKTTPKMMRFSRGKVQMSQIPYRYLKPTARLYEFGGDVKYTRGNFRTPVESVELLLKQVMDSLRRHLDDVHDALERLNMGEFPAEKFAEEIADPDCLLPYSAHIVWNAIQLQLQLIKLGLIPEDPGQAWLKLPDIKEKMQEWGRLRKESQEKK